MTRYCRHPKCDNPAIVRPVLTVEPRFRPADYRGAPARMRLGFEVCLIHKMITTPQDLVDDRTWNQVREHFAQAGVAEPGRDTLRLEWEDLYSGPGHAILN